MWKKIGVAVCFVGYHVTAHIMELESINPRIILSIVVVGLCSALLSLSLTFDDSEAITDLRKEINELRKEVEALKKQQTSDQAD